MYSHSWEDYPRHVTLVLEHLRTYGLTFSQKKCNFGQSSLPYLGDVVTLDVNHPQPRHVEAILNAAPPRNRKQLTSFLDTCDWLMEYIPHYSQ